MQGQPEEEFVSRLSNILRIAGTLLTVSTAIEANMPDDGNFSSCKAPPLDGQSSNVFLLDRQPSAACFLTDSCQLVSPRRTAVNESLLDGQLSRTPPYKNEYVKSKELCRPLADIFDWHRIAIA